MVDEKLLKQPFGEACRLYAGKTEGCFQVVVKGRFSAGPSKQVQRL
jgi:hypothetical protein